MSADKNSMPRVPNFAMIRAGPEDLGDYNVENMVLTPEDETNPELLAELSALVIAPASEPKEDKIAELKKEILTLKRGGDIEGAKAKLKELSELEKGEKGPVSETKVIETKQVPEPKLIVPMALESPVQYNLTEAETNSVRNQKNSAVPASTDTQVYRDLFAKLQKQSATCQTVSEFYTAANRKSDANLFIKRKQALDLETQKLRLMLKNKQPPPQSKTVNVTYEYMLSNPEIPEGQLQVAFGQLKVVLPRKFKLKDTEEYKLKISYELFGLSEQEINQTSEPFTTQGLTNSKLIIIIHIWRCFLDTLKPFMFKCNKRDVRAVKSVEYKKIRLEIVGETGFLFFKSEVVKATGQCKLDRLLKDCTFKEEIDLFDVEDGKKSAIPSAKLVMTAKMRSPLTSDGFKQNTEKWTVIPSFGFSNQTLYSDLSPPPVLSTLPPSIVTVSSSPKATGTLADNVKSFEVIEYELGLLAQNQNAVMSDATLMDLQVALEALRDRIQMQVELGEISLEGKHYKNGLYWGLRVLDYLNSVKECINDTKKLALEAKRAGDLQLAQKYVKHVDIMRKEVAEAEASMAAEEGE